MQCTPMFHAARVSQLRKFGVKQRCPLCRVPLPPGPDALIEEAAPRFAKVHLLVARGVESWSAFSAETQLDLDAAVTGLRAAAEHCFAEAQQLLGYLYESGYGVVQSDVEAFLWYKEAADQGNAEAECCLGNNFKIGRGVAQSDLEATRWWRKAADQAKESQRHKAT